MTRWSGAFIILFCLGWVGCSSEEVAIRDDGSVEPDPIIESEILPSETPILPPDLEKTSELTPSEAIQRFSRSGLMVGCAHDCSEIYVSHSQGVDVVNPETGALATQSVYRTSRVSSPAKILSAVNLGPFIVGADDEYKLHFLDINLSSDKEQTPVVLTGHTADIYTLEYIWMDNFNGDQRSYRDYVVSGGADKVLRIWDIEKQVLIHEIKSYTSIIYKTLKHSSKLYSIEENGKLHVLDLTNLSQETIIDTQIEGSIDISIIGSTVVIIGTSILQVRRFESLDKVEDEVLILDLLGGGLNVETFYNRVGEAYDYWVIFSTTSGRLYFYKLILNTNSNKYEFEKQKVVSSTFGLYRLKYGKFKDAHALYLQGFGGGIQIWNPLTQEKIKTLEERHSITSLYLSKDQLFTGSSDGIVRLWNIKNGTLIDKFTVSESIIGSVLLHEGILLAGDEAGVITAWDIAENKKLREFKGHEKWISKLDAHDHVLVSGSSDGSIRTWDVNTGKLLSGPFENKGVVSDLVLDVDEIASCDNYGNVYLRKLNGDLFWQVPETFTTTEKQRKKSEDPNWEYIDRKIECWSIAATQNRIITGHLGGKIQIWSRLTGEFIEEVDLHDSPVSEVAAIGSTIVSQGLKDGSLHIWHTQNDQKNKYDLFSKDAFFSVDEGSGDNLIRIASGKGGSIDIFEYENNGEAGTTRQVASKTKTKASFKKSMSFQVHSKNMKSVFRNNSSMDRVWRKIKSWFK
jgi:WD40 repeat protein